jgi:phage terminase large subunit-like protein
LNVQVGEGLTQDRWVGASLWKKTAKPDLTLASLIAQCEVAVIGIDGGGLEDLLGLTVIGRQRETRRWLSWSKAWAHKIVLERCEDIAPQLKDLAKAGELVICEEEDQDIFEVTEICVQLNEAGLLPEREAIGFDPEGVAAIVDALVDAEISDDQIGAVSQGYRLNGAIKGAERKLFNRSLAHADQELMTWVVSNAKTEARGNAIIVTKAQSGSAKIDPLMALFNAVMLMSNNPEAAKKGGSVLLELDEVVL